MGPSGIGKTAIMEQVARECGVGLVAYTITHHTRQSAVGLPRIVTRSYGGEEITITEYTMSEIVASVYDCMERTGKKEGILFIDEITVSRKHWPHHAAVPSEQNLRHPPGTGRVDDCGGGKSGRI